MSFSLLVPPTLLLCSCDLFVEKPGSLFRRVSHNLGLLIAFKIIRDTKGTFYAKKGSTKDRNGMGLTEAEDIKKRWQEYTEELYKKDLHNQDNHDGVITDLEPDILECEVKWVWLLLLWLTGCRVHWFQ